MTDPPRHPDPSHNVGVVPDRESTTSARPETPRWVKVSWSITLAVVVLFVIALVTKGPHRPGSHESFHGMGGRPPAIVPTAHTSSAGYGLSERGLG